MSKSARRRAREFALQGIYQWLLSGNSVAVIEQHMSQVAAFDKADGELFRALLRGAIGDAESLREALRPHLARALDDVSPVEHALLLLAAHELKSHPETPYRVVINEAIELAKEYGGTEGHKFVNGVIDKLATSFRSVETGRSHPNDETGQTVRAAKASDPLTVVVPDRIERLVSEAVGNDFVVYHNPDTMGREFGDEEGCVDDPENGFYTDKQAEYAKGARVWMVTGTGHPREYFLCGCFRLERIEDGAEEGFQSLLSGYGVTLPSHLRPSLNHEAWFPDFLNRVGHFGLGFQRISDEHVAAAFVELVRQKIASWR